MGYEEIVVLGGLVFRNGGTAHDAVLGYRRGGAAGNVLGRLGSEIAADAPSLGRIEAGGRCFFFARQTHFANVNFL